MLNNMFMERFGWKVRNGVFCYLKDLKIEEANIKLYNIEVFTNKISYIQNFNMNFSNDKADVLIHLTQWQYW